MAVTTFAKLFLPERKELLKLNYQMLTKDHIVIDPGKICEVGSNFNFKLWRIIQTCYYKITLQEVGQSNK